jgi:histone hairpin-like RNA-binding protein
MSSNSNTPGVMSLGAEDESRKRRQANGYPVVEQQQQQHPSNLSPASAKKAQVRAHHPESALRTKRRMPEREVETDAHRLKQRQKQIDIGKNTPGYASYVAKVPKYVLRPLYWSPPSPVLTSCALVDAHLVSHCQSPRLLPKPQSHMMLPTRWFSHLSHPSALLSSCRSQRTKNLPRTPDKSQVCSKRSWDGQIRKWRRLLHDFDVSQEDEEEIDMTSLTYLAAAESALKTSHSQTARSTTTTTTAATPAAVPAMTSLSDTSASTTTQTQRPF